MTKTLVRDDFQACAIARNQSYIDNHCHFAPLTKLELVCDGEGYSDYLSANDACIAHGAMYWLRVKSFSAFGVWVGVTIIVVSSYILRASGEVVEYQKVRLDITD
eukprot:7323764-Prymnesium_polylepis.1